VLDATRGLVAQDTSNNAITETAPAVRMVFVFMGLGLLLSKKLLTVSADKVAL
jgi:hypothetical protein